MRPRCFATRLHFGRVVLSPSINLNIDIQKALTLPYMLKTPLNFRYQQMVHLRLIFLSLGRALWSPTIFTCIMLVDAAQICRFYR